MISRPRSPGLRFVLLAAPSRPSGQWHDAAVVCAYSCGAAPALYRLPCSWEILGKAIAAVPGGQSSTADGGGNTNGATRAARTTISVAGVSTATAATAMTTGRSRGMLRGARGRPAAAARSATRVVLIRAALPVPLTH